MADATLVRSCKRALIAGARSGGTRQQVRAAARSFVRRHRRDASYLSWVLHSVGASSALAVALLGLSAAPAGAELAPFSDFSTAFAQFGQNVVPALGDLDGDGDLDLLTGELYGRFFYYQNTGTASNPVLTPGATPLPGEDIGSFSSPALGDLDGDGDLDLIAGEQSGSFVYYENTGSATSPAFTIGSTPLPGADVGSYSTPSLGDLDGDGDLDLVAGGSGGFFYFENTGSAMSPSFAAGVTNPFGLYYIPGGVPALGDLDRDGDLDFVSGENFGGFFTFENTGSATSPAFAARTGAANPLAGRDAGATSAPALGDLDRDGDPDLVSGSFNGALFRIENLAGRFVPVTGAANPLDGTDLGAVSTPALGDLDQDGDLDLIGGENFGVFNYLENTGSAANPAFIARTGSANPLDGQDVLPGGWSAPGLGDLDGDGDLDLIAGNGYGEFTYFENTGTPAVPAFVELVDPSPFGLTDVGNYAAPALADLDGDGDLDLVSGERAGAFFYFENTGSAASPAFAARTGAANPLDGKAVVGGATPLSKPSLGDADGDGDFDLVAGGYEGTFFYYENAGGATSPSFFARTGAASPLSVQDVGDYAAPSLGDLDSDGDLDLIAGEKYGTLHTFESFVVQSPPVRELIGAANPLAGQDVGSRAGPALADLDRDGDDDLVVGENLGAFLFFENTGSALEPAFIARTGAANPLNGRDVGDEAKPAFGDLDGDGDFDVLVGRLAGDVVYFANTGDAATPLFAAGVANPFGLLVSGTNSTAPALADLDSDGDLDLVAGLSGGGFFYQENTGSATSPAFSFPVCSESPLCAIDVGTSSTPAFADFDRDGDLDLVSGAGDGSFHYFKNHSGPARPPIVGAGGAQPPFAELTGAANPLAGRDVGDDSAPAAGSLNGDGFPDLVTGSQAGTFAVHYFPEPARGLLLGAGIALLRWLDRWRRQ